MTSSEVTLTREQLYESVWSEPVRTVAGRYGLSDRGLAKMCVRLQVPLPGRGYWAQKAVGKEPQRPRLPTISAATPLEEQQVTLTPDSAGAAGGTDSLAARQRAVEASPEHAIRVSSELVAPHPLVERTAKILRRAKADERKVLAPEATHGLDVRVTRRSLDRALRILDALLKALDARGFELTCHEDGQRRTSIKLLDEEINFYLEERIDDETRVTKRRITRDMVQYAWNPLGTYDSVVHDYTATGDLALRISDEDFLGTRRSWRDGRRQRLENVLNRFILGLVVTAEARKAERLRLEERQRQWEQERREEEERRRQQLEQERRTRLLREDLTAWHASHEIREYVAALRTGGDTDGSNGERADLAQWLEWVSAYADRIDPVRRGTPPNDS